MSEQNFKTFRGLLRSAICSRTQAQFANESGISAAHLNRMLNADTIFRPSNTTLHKIAAVAKNGITYQILKDALDEEAPNSVSPEDQAAKAAEAAADFLPEFSDLAREVMVALCEEIEDQSFPIMADSLAAYMDPLVSAVAKRKPNYPKISYDIGFIRPYPGRKYICAAKYVRVDLSMASKFEVASSDMLLYFTEIPCQDDSVKYVIQKASCAVDDIMELFGLPPAAIDAHTNGEQDEDKDISAEVMDAALADPFYLDIQESEVFHEVYRGHPGGTKEETLLNAIFGEKYRIPTFITGIGFELEEVPPKLLDFILAHRESVLASYKSEAENYDSLSAGLDALSQAQDLQPFMALLDEMGYSDADEESDAGWPAVISAVMSEETGFPFVYHKKSDDPDGKFPWLSKKSVVILSNEAAAKKGIQRESALLAVCRYLQELGLVRFGDILFTYIETVFQKPHTYVVKERVEPEDKDQELNENELADEDYSARFEDNPHPETNGLYAVKLKDGRKIHLIYLTSVKAWIKLHKEWSDLIESYCPKPIQVFMSEK